MKKIFVISFIVIIAGILFAGTVYAQNIQEIQARARAEARRSMGVTEPRPVVRQEIKPGSSDEDKIDLIRKLTLFAMVLALIPAAIAKTKGRSFIAWWVLGLVGFIIVLPASIYMKKISSTVVG